MAVSCAIDRSGVDAPDDPGPRLVCPRPCENGGVCLGNQCFCDPVDYEGETCSDRIDDCTGIDCDNGACLDGVRDYSCDCLEGWTIDADGRCTVLLVDCGTPNACVEGVCDDSSGAVVCDCFPGYHGSNCNVPVTCDPPRAPRNAYLRETTGQEYEDTAAFECLPGYGPGSSTVRCQANGRWEHPDLNCEAIESCGPPPPLEHATVSTPGGTGVGATAYYTCDDGFVPSDSSPKRVCLETLSWSQNALRCLVEGVCIDHDPCAHGTCEQVVDEGVRCVCKSGWSGPLCDTPTECDPALCAAP